MEVVANGEHGLAGRIGRHVYRLEALVVSECVGDSSKACTVAADKAGKRAVRAVACAGDVVDAVSAVDSGERQAGGSGLISYGRAAGIVQRFQANRRGCNRN